MDYVDYLTLLHYGLHLLKEDKIEQFETNVKPSIIIPISWSMIFWFKNIEHREDESFDIVFSRDGRYMCTRNVYDTDYFTSIEEVIDWVNDTVK